MKKNTENKASSALNNTNSNLKIVNKKTKENKSDNKKTDNNNKNANKTNKEIVVKNGDTGAKNGTTTKQKIVRSAISLSAIAGIFLAIYLILKLTGSLNKIDSPESLKEVILSGGSLSYLIFFIIQFLQVTFIPLPAVITTIAGSMVFGPWTTFFLSLSAVLIGSIFAFWLGRKFGRRLIVWIIGEKEAEKWGEKLAKGKYVFFLMMLLPGFPDDILCILAGATPMSYRFFITTNLITRPIVFASIAFLGGGQIIPFSGWGIPAWIVLVLLSAVAFYFSIKYQQKIEKKIDSVAEKIKRLFIG